MRTLLLTKPIIGAGLRTLLEQRWSESQVRQVGNCEPNKIISLVLAWQPDLTLLDGDHLQVVPLLATLDHQWVKKLGNIVILTTHPTEEELFETFIWGAQAYLSAFLEPNQIIEAINAVCQGHWMFDSAILSDPVLLQRRQETMRRKALVLESKALVLESKKPLLPKTNCLGEQEQALLLWVARGKTNKEIATLEGLTNVAVKQRFTHIFAKLNVFNRTEAVMYAMRAGWIPLSAIPNKKEAAS